MIILHMLASLSGFLITWAIAVFIQNIIYERNARQYLAFVKIGYLRILEEGFK